MSFNKNVPLLSAAIQAPVPGLPRTYPFRRYAKRFPLLSVNRKGVSRADDRRRVYFDGHRMSRAGHDPAPGTEQESRLELTGCGEGRHGLWGRLKIQMNTFRGTFFEMDSEAILNEKHLDAFSLKKDRMIQSFALKNKVKQL